MAVFQDEVDEQPDIKVTKGGAKSIKRVPSGLVDVDTITRHPKKPPECNRPPLEFHRRESVLKAIWRTFWWLLNTTENGNSTPDWTDFDKNTSLRQKARKPTLWDICPS